MGVFSGRQRTTHPRWPSRLIVHPARLGIGGTLVFLLLVATALATPNGRRPPRERTEAGVAAGRDYGTTDLESRSPTPSPGATPRVLSGPQPPGQGAYLGAAVAGQDGSDAGQLAAVRAFEGQIRRPLDIVHTYHDWRELFPSELDRAVVRGRSGLLLSWGGADTRSIATGQDDDLIRRRARAIRDLGVPVFLQWFGEMDNTRFRAQVWSPLDYVTAWRHIRSIFRAERAGNVGWVWCPTARAFRDGTAGRYYPGDDSVDWLCATAFTTDTYVGLTALLEPFLIWARHRPRPVMVSEFGAPEGPRGAREQWLADVRGTVTAATQIKALVYYNRDSYAEGTLRNWSLGDAPASIEAFRRLAADPNLNPARRPIADR